MVRATILIVKDSPDISHALADTFRFADFNPMQAFNAIQGLQFACELRPDLILMDIHLPDLDGLSAAETLKSDPVTRRIPIVAMTAYEVVGDQAKAISRYCVGYVQKPARPREVINLVSAILRLGSETKSSFPKDRLARTSRK